MLFFPFNSVVLLIGATERNCNMHVFFQHQRHLIDISITTNPCYFGLFIS